MRSEEEVRLLRNNAVRNIADDGSLDSAKTEAVAIVLSWVLGEYRDEKQMKTFEAFFNGHIEDELLYDPSRN